MRPNLAYAWESSPRTTSLSRLLLALLCLVGMGASLLQPWPARSLSKAETAFQVASTMDHAKGGKPCQRMVPGAVGTSCSAGAMVALEATTSVVLDPLSSPAGEAPFADMTLHVQWLGAPAFRPPRIVA